MGKIFYIIAALLWCISSYDDYLLVNTEPTEIVSQSVISVEQSNANITAENSLEIYNNAINMYIGSTEKPKHCKNVGISKKYQINLRN